VTIEDVHKDNPLEYLKFLTGRSFGVDTINGHFYDVRFEFEAGTLLETPKDIKKFFRTTIPTPTEFVGSE
jgi:cupin superfamily acireductone dioxygenase involved in methionine salvage